MKGYEKHSLRGDPNVIPFWTIKKCREYIGKFNRDDIINASIYEAEPGITINLSDCGFYELDKYKGSDELLLTQMESNMLHRVEGLINICRNGLQRGRLKNSLMKDKEEGCDG